MKDHEEDFAALLGRYRAHAGFTQQDLARKIGVHRNTIVKWETRASWPESRGQVLRLADELSLAKEERKAFLKAARFSAERWPVEFWLVPYQRDPFFVGRENELQSLRQLLVPGNMTALTQAISGLGGIGKTHTAAEYAYRFHQYYEAVLWLQADSWEVLASECIKLAAELGLPEQKETDQVIAEVQRWLRKHPHWLLILDNVGHPQKILPKFMPTGHQGSVLLTTRVHDVEPLAQTQVLSTLPEQEGVLFLLRRTKKIPSKAGLEQAGAAQRDEARQIWQLMGGLPLALDQAGAYILETGCSFPAYREQYNRRHAEFLRRRGKRFIGHEASVATTFSLAFERIKALNPVAADILHVCSLLQGEAIPEEIFLEGAAYLGPLLTTVRDTWDLAIGVLQEYSLVQRNADAKTLTMHQLVQAVLHDTTPASEQEEWTKRVISAINAVFPQEEHAWDQCERLVPHALVCATRTLHWKGSHAELASLLIRTGKYFYERAQYQEAEALFLRALHIQEQALGPERPNVGPLLNNLATLYWRQGRYEEAEVLHLRALHIQEQALGPEHIDLAVLLNALAELYREQGRYEEVEPLYLRALHIQEQTLGLEHPNVGPPLNNLATLYWRQGRYEEAETLYLRTLHIQEQALGSEHPNVVPPLNGLAILCREQGKYEEAEALHLRTLHIQEQALGPEHPDVAPLLTNLAILYRRQGRYTEAEPLYQRSMHIQEQALGPEHANVAYPLTNLAILYAEQGRYMEAELLLQRASRIREQALGPENVSLAYTLDALANVCTLQGRYEEAEVLYLRTLHIFEQALGSEHPNAASSLNGLANLYCEQGRYAEAEPLYLRALHIREQRQGLQNPETAEVMHDFAIFQEARGKKDEARSLYKRALTVREQILGPHHPKTKETRERYITLLRTMGRDDEAALLEAAPSQQAKTKEEQKAYPEE